MRPPPFPRDAICRFLKRIPESRFFTISLGLHIAFLLLVGGTILTQIPAAQPDFQSGADGLLMEQAESVQLPPEPAVADPLVKQTTAMPALPMVKILPSVLVASSKVSSWTMAELPKSSLLGMSDTLRNGLAVLNDRQARLSPPAPRAGGAAMGRPGGTTRSAMIFGKKIMASRLGVILDVSSSAHPRLAGAVTEIQNGFADATLILYPGCGMLDDGGQTAISIRKFSTIPPQELQSNGNDAYTTRSQISLALKDATFRQMTTRSSVQNTLFVAWYTENSYAKMIGQTQVAFEDLINRGVDAIYWFSDFEDQVDPRVAARLGELLKARRIVLHVHNFSDRQINPDIAELATGTGGTVDQETN